MSVVIIAFFPALVLLSSSYIYLGVLDQLPGDVPAAVFDGLGGELAVAVPASVWSVGVVRPGGGVLHTGGGDDAHGFPCEHTADASAQARHLSPDNKLMLLLVLLLL